MTESAITTLPPVGSLIRQWREAEAMTCRDLGAAVGLSAGKVSEIETGKYRPGVKPALEIERISGGRIDASDLNDDVRLARHGHVSTSRPPDPSSGKDRSLSRNTAASVTEKSTQGS